MSNPERSEDGPIWQGPFSFFCNNKDIKRILEKLETFMATFEQFVQDTKDHNQATSDALTDLAGDIQTLSELVASLQQAAGTLTKEQQAVLDELDAKGKEIAER